MRFLAHLLILLNGFAMNSLAKPIDFRSEVQPILEANCFNCHGAEKQKGKLRLDTLSGDLLNDRPAAETWHDVREAIQLGEMPPEDEPHLDAEDRRQLVGWIDQEIEAMLAARKDTDGRVVLRRLNRVEYQNTMRDLLGIETDYAKNLPPDGRSEDGFQNDGSTLQMSDLQLDYYLDAAREGLRKAIVSGPEPEVFRHSFTKSSQDKKRGSNLLDDHEVYVGKMMEYPDEGEFRVKVRARAALVPGRGYPQQRLGLGAFHQFKEDVPLSNLFVTMMNRVGYETPSFVDSTGELTELV